MGDGKNRKARRGGIGRWRRKKEDEEGEGDGEGEKGGGRRKGREGEEKVGRERR